MKPFILNKLILENPSKLQRKGLAKTLGSGFRRARCITDPDEQYGEGPEMLLEFCERNPNKLLFFLENSDFQKKWDDCWSDEIKLFSRLLVKVG